MEQGKRDKDETRTRLYRQSIGLLAARASGGSCLPDAKVPLFNTPLARQQSHQEFLTPSLPSRQVAIHLFEYKRRHPGYVPLSLVAQSNAMIPPISSSSPYLSSPRPTDALPPPASASFFSHCPSVAQAFCQPVTADTTHSYLPCCTGCGGVLQPGDCLTTTGVRLERSPLRKLNRSMRRRMSRKRSQAKQKSNRKATNAAVELGGLSLIKSIVSSAVVAETPSACKNYLVMTCRICQSSYSVPGHSRNPHPWSAQPNRHSRKSSASTPSKTRTPRTAAAGYSVPPGTHSLKGREPPATASRNERLLEDYISLPQRGPLPQRIQQSSSRKKRKSSSSGNKKLLDFLSSLND